VEELIAVLSRLINTIPIIREVNAIQFNPSIIDVWTRYAHVYR
jgi:hypothetical protein